MQLAPDLDTGPAQLGRGGVCEGCAAEPLALLQRREKQAAARHPVGRVWPFSRRRPARVAACGRLVGGEQPQPAWGCSGGCGDKVVPLAQSRKGAWSGPLTSKMSARVTAQARSTLAAAPAPAVCTLGVVRPRNECGILLRKVQLVRHTSQSRNRAKSADTHTNNRRGYE